MAEKKKISPKAPEKAEERTAAAARVSKRAKSEKTSLKMKKFKPS